MLLLSWWQYHNLMYFTWHGYNNPSFFSYLAMFFKIRLLLSGVLALSLIKRWVSNELTMVSAVPSHAPSRNEEHPSLSKVPLLIPPENGIFSSATLTMLVSVICDMASKTSSKPIVSFKIWIILNIFTWFYYLGFIITI